MFGKTHEFSKIFLQKHRGPFARKWLSSSISRPPLLAQGELGLRSYARPEREGEGGVGAAQLGDLSGAAGAADGDTRRRLGGAGDARLGRELKDTHSGSGKLGWVGQKLPWVEGNSFCTSIWSEEKRG